MNDDIYNSFSENGFSLVAPDFIVHNSEMIDEIINYEDLNLEELEIAINTCVDLFDIRKLRLKFD